MNEKNLVICDKEVNYADRLGENIRNHGEFAVRVFVCSSLEYAMALAKERTIHIFLADEAYGYEERRKVEAGETFVLGKGRATELGEGEVYIGKYRSADQIIRDIFETYMERTNENMIRTNAGRKAELIAVYSPIHRTGKTTFAIAYGKECAREKRTLYLNLEEYAAIGADDEGENLSDLLYYMKQGNGNLELRISNAARKMGDMDYVPPAAVSEDLKEIAPGEWKNLLGQILECGMYETVILDPGESIQGIFGILEMCGRIYMPVLNDGISREKLRRYAANLERIGKEKISKATIMFTMSDNEEMLRRKAADYARGSREP